MGNEEVVLLKVCELAEKQLLLKVPSPQSQRQESAIKELLE